MHLKHSPEAKGTITEVAAENKNGNKEFKNRNGEACIVNADLCIGCGVCA
jgi:ferredoxin